MPTLSKEESEARAARLCICGHTAGNHYLGFAHCTPYYEAPNSPNRPYIMEKYQVHRPGGKSGKRGAIDRCACKKFSLSTYA